ncbi:MarR family winged helix-turn-helix transcriptional regulator [Pedobacter sp.]|uniref:MarR family winged helix-turn-helix transcriptional regulator n=1 Tax=Pedobacter sp. TaxID=1411316 RepID=UPI003D7FA4B4
MYYDLVKELVTLVSIYEKETEHDSQDVHLFGQWLNDYQRKNGQATIAEPEWEGKAKGRSAESVINTSLVHLYRYAKLQAKTAIANTAFSTPDDFIYLISLVSFGSMTKTALIKLNVHEKSAGIQIVNRLINSGLVEQSATDSDKRNRMIHITEKGALLLKESMDNIKKASMNVTEPLSYPEKMDLIRLLQKLENFHELKSRGAL